jgi:hypothetical protein
VGGSGGAAGAAAWGRGAAGDQGLPAADAGRPVGPRGDLSFSSAAAPTPAMGGEIMFLQAALFIRDTCRAAAARPPARPRGRCGCAPQRDG